MKKLVYIVLALVLCLSLIEVAIVTSIPANAQEVEGTISGNVIATEGGGPVSGAKVTVFEVGIIEPVGEVFTDGDGKYTTMNLPAGQYIIQVQADGYAWEVYEDSYDTHFKVSVQSLTIDTPGQNIPDVNFSLEPEAVISGFVKTSEGVPIANASIGAVAFISETQVCMYGAVTETDGSYTLEGKPAGNYRLQAGATGYIQQFYDGQDFLDNVEDITVAEGENSGIDFYLTPGGGSISGHVYEADGVTPITGLTVLIYVYDGGDWILAYRPWPSGPDGYYPAFGGAWLSIAPGEYKVRAWADGYVEQWWPEKSSLEEAETVTVIDGEVTENIDFSLFTPSQLHETPLGDDVPVYDPSNGITLIFDHINEGGVTSIVVTDEEPVPTSGFQFLDEFYDISTTA